MTRELLENEHDTKDGADFEEYNIKNDDTSDMSIQDVNDMQNEQDKEKYTEDMPSRSQGDDASRQQGDEGSISITRGSKRLRKHSKKEK